GPFELTIRSEHEKIALCDVFVGDVWLAGGQSNMQWSLKESAEAEGEIANAANPLIRYYDVPRVAYEDGSEHVSEWKVCSPDNAPAFSAVAYHFARYVHTTVDVPIGVIGCNFGATSASCWMAESYLLNDPNLRVYADEFNEQIVDFDWSVFELENK